MYWRLCKFDDDHDVIHVCAVANDRRNKKQILRRSRFRTLAFLEVLFLCFIFFVINMRNGIARKEGTFLTSSHMTHGIYMI